MYKFGRNIDVDAAAEEDICNIGGKYPWIATAGPCSFVSSSVNDAAAGTGTQEVIFYGLDENGAPQIAVYETNGTTPVVTTEKWLRLHRVWVTRTGSGGVSAGTITFTVDSKTPSIIDIGVNATFNAAYTVPLKTNGYLKYVWATVLKSAAPATNGQANMLIYIRPDRESFRPLFNFGINTFGNELKREYIEGLVLEPLTDIVLTAQSGVDNMDISGGFDIELVETA